MSEQMTAQQAQSFDRIPMAHIAILDHAAKSHGCSCQAYVDWFTYNRWKAQGQQVQKGEKGTKLTKYVPVHKVNKETGEKEQVGIRPKGYSVFCRHQVKAKGQ